MNENRALRPVARMPYKLRARCMHAGAPPAAARLGHGARLERCRAPAAQVGARDVRWCRPAAHMGPHGKNPGSHLYEVTPLMGRH
eukprot:365289-Chlamydomonas_euryale.AAC.24